MKGEDQRIRIKKQRECNEEEDDEKEEKKKEKMEDKGEKTAKA